MASFAVAFVWSCTFEVPFVKLQKMIFGALLGPRIPANSWKESNEETAVKIGGVFVIDDKKSRNEDAKKIE